MKHKYSPLKLAIGITLVIDAFVPFSDKVKQQTSSDVRYLITWAIILIGLILIGSSWSFDDK